MQDALPADAQEHGSSAADRVRAYHQRTKHRFERYAAGPETLDWDAQPAPFRHFDGAPRILLPLADTLQPGPLGEALARPFATLGTRHPAVPPSLPALGALLHLSLGITAWKRYGPDRWAVRANPSSGNLHPTEAYLIVCGLPDLPDGVYHYEPQTHALECRARFLVPGLPPGVHIALASIMWREAWKYGERAFRYCQLDTGHAMGALRYASGMLGWTLCAQTQVDTASLAWLTGLDRLQDFPARRQRETELEEAELLLSLGCDGLAPRPPDLRALRGAAASAVWMGVASAIDPHPMYRWPVIGEIAQLTRNDAHPQPPHRQIGLDLPPETPEDGSRTEFRQIALTRRSAQHFDPAYRMTRAAFSHLLGRLLPSHTLPWDVMPSPWALDLVLFIHRVEDLAPGVYLLPRSGTDSTLRRRLAHQHSLQRVPGLPPGLELLCLATLEPPALQRLARSLHCHQDIAAHACFALGMMAEFDAALATTPAAYRDLHRQAGLLGQVLYLEAEAHGLRGTGIGCFFDDAVHELLGLEGSACQTLYHFTVGKPREDARIEQLAAYAERQAEPQEIAS